MKAFIDTLDMNNVHHRGAMTTLGANLPVIDAYISLLEQQESIVEEVTEAIDLTNDIRRLELEILKLEGKDLEVIRREREYELEALDESLRPLMERIYALRDEQTALKQSQEALDQSQNAIQTFVNAMLSVTDMLDKTKQSIAEFGLSEQELYKLRKQEADTLMDALGEMTDPKMIEDTVKRINDLVNQGWGLLDDSQKSRLKGSYLDYLEEVQALAEERLSVGLAPILGDEIDVSLEGTLRGFSEIMANLDGSLGNSSKGFEQSSAEMREAAREITAAVNSMHSAVRNIPTTVEVKVHDREVN
jgi:hypothetical protein